MGGWGSGRHGGRPVVEDGLTLDLCGLIRTRCRTGTARWFVGGRQTASIGWRIDLSRAVLTLNYVAGDDRETVNQHIALTTTKPHFGGVRWWMLCPVTGKRVAKLYSGWGYSRFASREALGWPADRSVTMH